MVASMSMLFRERNNGLYMEHIIATVKNDLVVLNDFSPRDNG
jgi:hypothetical protein